MYIDTDSVCKNNVFKSRYRLIKHMNELKIPPEVYTIVKLGDDMYAPAVLCSLSKSSLNCIYGRLYNGA